MTDSLSKPHTETAVWYKATMRARRESVIFAINWTASSEDVRRIAKRAFDRPNMAGITLQPYAPSLDRLVKCGEAEGHPLYYEAMVPVRGEIPQ